MGLFTVTARVMLMSEEDMDNCYEFEKLGTEPKSSRWVWRDIGLRTYDIYRIIGYNSNKCIILGYDGTQTLVKESFEQVYKKWKDNLGNPEEEYPEYEEDYTESDENEEDGED